MWSQIVTALAQYFAGVQPLVDIYGANMRYAGAETIAVPLLEWSLVADGETEIWAPTVIQVNQWCRTPAQLVSSEQTIRRLLHRDGMIEIGGLRMWSEYLDGDALQTPDRDGIHARAIRFTLTPLRDLYAQR